MGNSVWEINKDTLTQRMFYFQNTVFHVFMLLIFFIVKNEIFEVFFLVLYWKEFMYVNHRWKTKTICNNSFRKQQFNPPTTHCIHLAFSMTTYTIVNNYFLLNFVSKFLQFVNTFLHLHWQLQISNLKWNISVLALKRSTLLSTTANVNP